MSDVIADIIEGSGTKDTYGWKSLTRIIKVRNCSGETLDAMIDDAILKTGVNIEDPIPVQSGSGVHIKTCKLSEISGETMEDKGKIKLTLTYTRISAGGLFEDGAIEFDSSTNSEETCKDKDGTDIYFSYHWLDSDPTNPLEDNEGNKVDWTDEPPVMMQVMKPQITWTVNKKMEKTKAEMKTFIHTYSAKVNSSEWDGNAARTVLCANINAVSRDGGQNWECRFVYQKKESTWDSTDYYTKPNGKAPTAAEFTANPNAKKITKVQGEVSFTDLPTGEDDEE